MRGSFVALGLVAMLATSPAVAQTKPDPFRINEESTMPYERSLPVAADKRIVAGPGIRGAVNEVMGKTWWKVLSYCAGVYKYQIGEAEKKGDTARVDAVEKLAHEFRNFASDRLVADRGIAFAAATIMVERDMDYNALAAEDGGEEFRPFAVDEQRCRDVRFGYVVVFRPHNRPASQ